MNQSEQSRLKVEPGILSLPELGANYWSVPKCGNTSIKYACLSALGVEFQEDPDDVYLAVHSVRYGTYIEKKQALKNGLLNFSVIRHPLDRTISMYQDMAGKRKETKKIGGSVPFQREWNSMLAGSHSFSRFVDLLCRYREKDRDVHFRSFTPRLLVGKNKIGPSLIICLEDMHERLAQLNSKLLKPLDIPHLHATRKVVDVSENDRRKLEAIWQRDIALWEACKRRA